MEYREGVGLFDLDTEEKGDIMGIFTDYLTDLGMQAGEKFLKKKYSKRELKCSLEQFIEEQRDINEVSAFTEEIDFEGLANYIMSDLLYDVEKYLFGKRYYKWKEREVIFNKANCYGNPEKIKTVLEGALDILQEYYRKNEEYIDWKRVEETEEIIVADIVDGVVDGLEGKLEEIKNCVRIMSQNIKDDKISESVEELTRGYFKGFVEQVETAMKHGNKIYIGNLGEKVKEYSILGKSWKLFVVLPNRTDIGFGEFANKYYLGKGCVKATLLDATNRGRDVHIWLDEASLEEGEIRFYDVPTNLESCYKAIERLLGEKWICGEDGISMYRKKQLGEIKRQLKYMANQEGILGNVEIID